MILALFFLFLWPQTPGLSTGQAGFIDCARLDPGEVVELSSTTSAGSSIATLPCDSAVSILERQNGWFKVKTPDGILGYVRSRSVSHSSKVVVNQQPLLPPNVQLNTQTPSDELNRVLPKVIGPPNEGVGSGSGIGQGFSAGSVTPPRLKYKTEPEMPQAARRAGREGTVVIRVTIGSDGKIHDPQIVRSLDPELDQKALEAVNQWIFEPATKDGHKVAVFASIEVNFRLR